MLTKNEFLTSLAREIDATAALGARLGPQHLDFRLTPAQRSTQELLEYLTVHLAAGLGFFVTGSWDLWERRSEQAKGVAPAAFPAAMQAQYQAVERMLAPISDARFVTMQVRHWSGKRMTLAEACSEYLLKFAVAYKMQLFLQVKAAGLSELGSAELWA